LAAFDTGTLLLTYVPGAQVAKQAAGTLDASLTIIGGSTPLTASKPVNAGVVPENKVSVDVSLDPASTFGDATTTFNPLIRLNGTPRFAASNGSFEFPGSIKLSVIEDSTNDVTSATAANRYFVGSGGTISDPIGSVSLTPGVRAYKRKIELVSNDDGTGIAFASGTTGTSEIASANTQKVTLTETALVKSATVSGQQATSGTPFIARAGETWSYAIKASAFTGSPGSPTFTGTAVTVPVGFVNPSFVAASGGFVDLTANASLDQVNGTFTINSGFKTSSDVVGRIKLTNLLDGRNSVTIFVKIKANQGTIGGGIG
jgi:hypothetical protein